MIIKKLKNPGYWDEELTKFRGSLFMTCEWITTVSDNAREPVYLKFFEDDKLVALLGGIEFVPQNGYGKELFFYSGIAAYTHDPELICRCKNALYNYACKNGNQRISIRSYDSQACVKAGIKQFRVRERMEYVFQLDGTYEQITKCFKRDIRRTACKAKREGVILAKSSSPELTSELFRLIGETYDMRQSKGYGAYSFLCLPFFSRSEIEKLVEKGYASFYFAEKDNDILSMQLVLDHGKKAYCILMGTNKDGYRSGAPSFMFFELSILLREEGYSYYNIGGVPRSKNHSGLKRFKDNLGAEIIKSNKEVTDFLCPPLCYLNPLLELKSFIRGPNFLPAKLKNLIILIIDLILRKRDRIYAS